MAFRINTGQTALYLGGAFNWLFPAGVPPPVWGSPLSRLTELTIAFAFKPDSPLVGGNGAMGTLNNGRNDIIGNRMEQPYQSSFLVGYTGGTSMQVEVAHESLGFNRMIGGTLTPGVWNYGMARWRASGSPRFHLMINGESTQVTPNATTITQLTIDPTGPIEAGYCSNMDVDFTRGEFAELAIWGHYKSEMDALRYTALHYAPPLLDATARLRYIKCDAFGGSVVSAGTLPTSTGNATTPGHGGNTTAFAQAAGVCPWSGFNAYMIGFVSADWSLVSHPPMLTTALPEQFLTDASASSDSLATALTLALIAPTMAAASASSETVARALIPSPYPPGYVRQFIEDGPSLPVEKFEMAEREDRLGKRSGQVISVATPTEMTQAIDDVQPGGDIIVTAPLASGTWNLKTKAVTDATPRMPPRFSLRPISQNTPVRRPTR